MTNPYRVTSVNVTPPQAEMSPGRRLELSPWAGLALALVAGAIAWGVIQGVHPVFHVSKEFEAPNIGMPPEVYVANRRAREDVERKHAMLYAAILGALVAGALGLGDGAMRRSVLPALVAAPLGALGGVMGGWLGSAAHEYILEHVGQPELTHTMREQLCLLVPLGLGVGAGLGLSAGSWKSGLQVSLAGLAAGLVAALAYPVTVSLVLPQSSTDMLLPMDAASRAMWLGVTSALLGLMVPLGSRVTPGNNKAEASAR